MKFYAENLIGGLAMSVIGPPLARLVLNALVVLVGFLILSGAVNTAIIGSNGVLNRVAEDGVMPDWFLRPHRRYGTTHRVLYLIVGMQLAVILLSRGNMYVLGEAYAFGIVWSFVLQGDGHGRAPLQGPQPARVQGAAQHPHPRRRVAHRPDPDLPGPALRGRAEHAYQGGGHHRRLDLHRRVPGHFIASERYHERRRGRAKHKHIEQFNQRSIDQIGPELLSLGKPYRKLVAIRSTQNLFMLEKALAETDPETTDVAVMTAQVAGRGDTSHAGPNLDEYNRRLMTAVVERAEKAGKHVQPLILRTNSPLFAIVQTAKELQAQELVLGASNIHTADAQMEQIAFYWINIHGGEPQPLTVRILSRSRDLYFDIAGGNRIPKIGERQARSVAELRSAGVGVSHVLLVHDGTVASSDLFAVALTTIDPDVALTVVHVPSSSATVPGAAAAAPSPLPLGEGSGVRAPNGAAAPPEAGRLQQDLERAEQLHREVEVCQLPAGDPTDQLAALAGQLGCGLLILRRGTAEAPPPPVDPLVLARKSPCPVCFIESPGIPDEVDR